MSARLPPPPCRIDANGVTCANGHGTIVLDLATVEDDGTVELECLHAGCGWRGTAKVIPGEDLHDD